MSTRPGSGDDEATRSRQGLASGSVAGTRATSRGRVVEEIESGDEGGGQGTLARRSDVLGLAYGDDSDLYDSYDEDYSEDDLDPNMPQEERDEILVESAMRRIQDAQERGSSDVHLSSKQLAALERHKKRMEEERVRRRARRREREQQRVAVPISQLSFDFGSRSSASSPEPSEYSSRSGSSTYPPNSASMRKRSGTQRQSSVGARDREAYEQSRSTASSRSKTATAGAIKDMRPVTPGSIAANATPPASARNSPNSADNDERSTRRKTRSSTAANNTQESSRRHR
ncbi:putative COPII vesicles protein Yip3 [Ceratocystis lukuohia]|uniref:COPII vesicles protein Yip3 n=1 Tax=Ceratocystis lukuohia TaxID=2019550 RepID=A0ABR4MB51_9PEZI